MLSFIFVTVCGNFEWKRICAVFFFYRLFIYVMQLEIQLSREEGWDLINWFNPTICLCLSQARICISNVICRGLFCVQWLQLRWKVIVGFVDIGGIDDHHCLNFLFIIYTKFILWNRIPNAFEVPIMFKYNLIC
jgi:hypothetical protein